jgi:DNA-binding XRE family transcriptional regulator
MRDRDLRAAGAKAEQSPRVLLALPGTTSRDHFGQRLKAYRVAAGLTQHELAAQIGLRMQTLANYEHELRLPGWLTIRKLIRVLGVGVVDLWNERAEVADSQGGGERPRRRMKTSR